MSCLGPPLRLAYWIVLSLSLFAITCAAATQKSISVSSTDFGAVQVGSTMITPVVVTNFGKYTFTISQATTSGSGYSFVGPNLPITLSPGKSANLSVAFGPGVAGAVSGSLTVVYATAWSSRNGRFASAAGALSGTGTGGPGYLSAPSSLSFGSIAIGSSQTKALTLSNTGGTSLTISSAGVTGTGFTVNGLAFPYSLASGASANLSLTFSPVSSGTNSASLAIASNASDSSVTVSLTGSGTTTSGTIGVTPGSMSFGSVTIGSTQTQSGTVIANGGSITLSSASSTNSAFTVAGLALPMTLAAGQSAPFTLTFAPTATGTATASISFFASNSTSTSETATGSAVTVQHTVELSWNASTPTPVAGYNVYRATSLTGSYSRINSVLNPSMNYGDSTVQSGQTYYYATTAVDSTGAESTYSNKVQAAIPFP